MNDISNAISKLAENEEERRRLAKGALERVKDFSWEKKAEMVNSIYNKAVSK